MKLAVFFLLAAFGLLISCGLTERPEALPVELSPAPPTQQPSPLATEEPISVRQTSPVATPTVKLTIFQSPVVITASPTPTLGASGTEPGGRQAVFPNTIIVYQRQGGLAGGWQQWTVYHTGRIVVADGPEWQASISTVQALFDLVEAPDFWNLQNSYAPERECLDCLTQTVTIYYEGDIKEITVINEPPDLPQNLKQVLRELDDLIAP